ncbi:MAG: TonB-dependent receptor [Terracidiphilus sp.]|jgi:iron complex outermembrane receptor protein/vitamin B12 transporter
MPDSAQFFFCHLVPRMLPRAFAFFLVATAITVSQAASIRGVVTDASGAKITGATVVLISGGKAVASDVSKADGSFQILSGSQGRFFLVVSASSFRQLETPGFYAGQLDSIERDIVLEPQWVRESIVVTATGTPTPQPQTSSATSVIGPQDLPLRSDLTSALRLMPGTVVVQEGQMGAQTSLFIRGGNSDANKILLDGVSAGDMGGQFDLGPLSTTAIERAEVYRGPDSNLYGADAGSGVVSLTTPHGTTSFPSILLQADGGNLSTSREELEVAGAHNKLDYLGAFSWLQTTNNLPNDEYHVATTAANFGYQLNGTTQLRGTLHYGVDATGVPNAWDFYHVADNATQKDQDLFISASIDNQTTPSLHNMLRYGATRKREQYTQGAQEGGGDFDAYGDSLGDLLTITGANGYSVTGQAILDYAGTYPNGYQQVSNRDQIVYQGDYRFTPHLIALIGFHYADERATLVDPSYDEDYADERTDYDYLASVHGDFKNRFFYTLGGSLERNSLFGTETSPRAGLSYYALPPRKGVFSGTRILFNYGEGVREPKLTDKFYSLYYNLPAIAQQLHIGPLAAPNTRSYEGGVEQTFFGERVSFRSSYFHNEFGKEIESVPAPFLLTLFPTVTVQGLGSFYTNDSDLTFNTQAFRAQGVEATVEYGVGKNLFFRGGYTYLDAVVQRSFTSDNVALLGGYAPTYPSGCSIGTQYCIPLGAFSPLVGARPFRRPPHTGFFTASYATKRLTGVFSSAIASRSDDSTFLFDVNYGDTLILPNRNLDWGYAKLDLGASYKLLSWLKVYGQGENLMNNQHIAPIGYPSLPFNIRAGLRIEWTKASSQ